MLSFTESRCSPVGGTITRLHSLEVTGPQGQSPFHTTTRSPPAVLTGRISNVTHRHSPPLVSPWRAGLRGKLPMYELMNDTGNIELNLVRERRVVCR